MSLVDLFTLVLQYCEEKKEEEDDQQGVDLLQSKLQQWRSSEERQLQGEHSRWDCGFLRNVWQVSLRM